MRAFRPTAFGASFHRSLVPVGRGSLAIVIALVVGSPAVAQVVWQGDNVGHPSDWNKNPNWTPSGKPTATQIAQFTNMAVNTNPNINVTGLVVGELAFTSNALSYQLSSSGGNTLTINGIGGVGINNAAANSQTISSGIVLGGDQAWSVTNSAGVLAVSGAISGTGRALTKSGAGTLTLSGANTYTGATTISAGTLSLTGSGSITNSPTITVAAGATLNVAGVTGGTDFSAGTFAIGGGRTLAGSGTVVGAMGIGSTAAISPGTGTTRATLTVGATSLQSGGFYDVDLGSFTNLSDTDLLDVIGAVTTSNLSTIRIHNQAGTTPTDMLTRNYTIAHATGGVNLSSVPTISASGFAAGDQFSLSTINGNLILSYTPVPEPAAVMAVFLGGLGLVQAVRRLRRPPSARDSRPHRHRSAL
jgi:autotransporter-associated beta strand protein